MLHTCSHCTCSCKQTPLLAITCASDMKDLIYTSLCSALNVQPWDLGRKHKPSPRTLGLHVRGISYIQNKVTSRVMRHKTWFCKCSQTSGGTGGLVVSSAVTGRMEKQEGSSRIPGPQKTCSEPLCSAFPQQRLSDSL